VAEISTHLTAEYMNTIIQLYFAILDVLQCIDMSCMDIVKGVCGEVNRFMDPVPCCEAQQKAIKNKKELPQY